MNDEILIEPGEGSEEPGETNNLGCVVDRSADPKTGSAV